MKRLVVPGLLGLALLVSACGAETAESPTSQAREWDVATWEPTEPVNVPPMTDEERMEARVEHLDSIRGEYNAQDLETPDLVRWTTFDDHGPAIAECLTDAGFPATSPFQGAIDVDSPGSAEARRVLNQQWWQCEAMFSERPEQQKYANEETVNGAWHDYYSTYFVPCLEENFDITLKDSVTVPSREAFISSQLDGSASGLNGWPPTTSQSFDGELAPAVSGDATNPDTVRIFQVCPMLPPFNAIYGQ